MCGRFAVTTDPAILAAELDAVNEVAPQPLDKGPAATTGADYNVGPTRTVMTVVKRHSRDEPDDDPALRIRAMRWGLVPFWAKEFGKGAPMFNARAETAPTMRSFRDAVKSRRLLVPMDGWYEWRPMGDATATKPPKQAYYMSPKDGTRLFMAGLWSTWRPKGEGKHDDPPKLSCTILTTDAVGPLQFVHDRMPLIMPAEQWDAWLDPDHPVDPELLAAPSMAIAEAVDIRPVSALVNSVRNNGAELIDRVEPLGEQETLL